MRARLFSLLRQARQARDDGGFAVPVVLLMMIAAFAIVTVGVTSSISAQRGSTRDQASKSALATAEAGVSQALMAYNGDFIPSASAPCLMPVSNPAGTVQPRAAQVGGWCAAAPPGSVAGGTYQYQVCPRWSDTQHACLTSGEPGPINIISTGTYNGVTRRVAVISESSASPPFHDAGVISQNNLALDCNAEVHADSQAGGSLALGATGSGCTSPKLCGFNTVGPSGNATGLGLYTLDTACTGAPQSLSTIGHAPVTLPPVNQGSAPTQNSNCRITGAISGVSACSDGTKDLINGSPGNVSWDASTRRLALSGQKTSLTLGGSVYSFCRLNMTQNSTIYAQANTTVNVYFDDPTHCNPQLPAYNPASQAGTAQAYLESNTAIKAGAGSLALWFVGSPTTRTGIVMSSNSDTNAACVQNFILYAPLTDIELRSNSTYCGAIAGYSIHLNQNARFYQSDATKGVSLPGPPVYTPSRFVDCSAAPASPPDAGC